MAFALEKLTAKHYHICNRESLPAGVKMSDKHWIRDLNGSPVIVIDFLEPDNIQVRIGDDADYEIWPLPFWRSLPMWQGTYA